jgi:ABC-2 type transport system ATP-binding protein
MRFMSSVLTVKDLQKIYPSNTDHIAVDTISFELKESEILGLLGPNGSGKTTTIQMLLGTLSFSSGSITYFGKDFTQHRSEVLQRISFASAYTSLPWSLTVAENLSVFGRLYGLNPKESVERFEPLLKRFGLSDKRNARVSSLSAGQITRLMIVKAFFIHPKIVLLDEPTASLDPDIANEICDFILEQRDTTGLSVLFTSHKMEEASELCDRVIFLKEGKIIADDLPKNLALKASAFRVKLVIVDGMKRTIGLAEKRNMPYTIDHKSIEIAISESDIPLFLNEIGQAGITYASIRIEEPSLEDYFLQIARKI